MIARIEGLLLEQSPTRIVVDVRGVGYEVHIPLSTFTELPDLGQTVALHRPDVAAIEQVFVAANPRSALVLGQARGALLSALAAAGLTIREYSPSQIKQAVTGDGRASKRQVQTMVRRQLSLERAPASDAADALAAAIRHAHAGRLEALGVMPRGSRRRRRGGFVVNVRPSR